MKMSCPDDERLADYVEGRLSEEDRFRVEEHIADCQMCMETLVLTKGLEKEMDRLVLDPVSTEVTEGAVRLVTRKGAISQGSFVEPLKRAIKQLGTKISDALGPMPWGTLQPAPIRGSKIVASDDLVRLTVPFKKIKTEIEIEKKEGDKALIRVKLHKASKDKKGVRVTLKKSEREIASYILEEAYVRFEDIPFGHYSIILLEDGGELGSFPFEIKGSSNCKK